MNPIHERDGKWYFWGETWADELGPYDTEADAKVACEEYVKYIIEFLQQDK